jgi:hypothetical protein
MLFFIKKKLSDALMPLAEDIRSETMLAILTQANLKIQLSAYVKANEIPKGRDLSLLKAVMYRQRLKFIWKENRHGCAPPDEECQHEEES